MPEQKMKDIKVQDKTWKKIMNIKINKGFSSAGAVVDALLNYYKNGSENLKKENDSNQ
jgi:hypothetical protein